MATTVTSPNYWTLTLTSNTASTYNFKFVVDITIGGVVVARIKQPKNLNNSAHLSFEKIVKNYINITHKHGNTIVGTQYDSIHLMPQNIPNPSGTTYNDFIASKNSGDLRTVLFKFYEEYATSSGGAITIHASGASDITKAVINYANSWEDQKVFDLSRFDFDSASTPARFLTGRPTETTNPNDLGGKVAQLTSATDYQTLSMFNEKNTYFNTENGRILYKFYEDKPATFGASDNHVGVISVQNAAVIGSESPSSSNTEDEFLIYLGSGGANVLNMKYAIYGGYQPTASIKYYTIQYISTDEISQNEVHSNKIKAGEFVEITTVGNIDWTLIGAASSAVGVQFYATGAAADASGRAEVFEYEKLSKTYLFEMVSDANGNASKYAGKNIAWKNKEGVWSYYYFDGASSDKESYKRKTQRENVAGSWNAATFTIDTFERGKVDKIEGAKLTTINTRYIDEAWNDHFKSLLMSNEVQIIEGGKSYPINIKNTTFDIKTNLKDKLVQYSFTYEYSHALKSIV